MVKILGIVNITPDSFSDGGNYLLPDKAIAHGKQLLQEGADILDLGAASSHPDSALVSAEEELRRLKPVLAALKKQGASISLDSFSSSVQLFGLAQEVDYLNDVSGFMDEAIYPQLAQASCSLIVMHSIQSAKTGKAQATREAAPKDIFASVCSFFDSRLAALVKAGIDESRLIIDCGWGFFLGNQPEPSIEMLSRLGELKTKYNLPVLASVSRKSFLRAITGKALAETQPATLAAELFAVLQGADYIRTHEAAPLKDGLKIHQALK
jgi:dihydropteroate synthase type 2